MTAISPGLPSGSQTYASVVIATRNRPRELGECLGSISAQTQLPLALIVVDSSDSSDTQEIVKVSSAALKCETTWIGSSVRSAAVQRNMGAALVKTDLVCFLDDDVILAPSFLAEIIAIFMQDREGTIGGVCGVIEGHAYVAMSRLNSLALRAITGFRGDSFAGRLVGPALNFLAADGRIQEVDWLPSGCTAYRTSVFNEHRFGSTFDGYSLAEDVHLSARIAKGHRLLCTPAARLTHKDLGKSDRRKLRSLAAMDVINREYIMREVLGRRTVIDYARFFAYQLAYVPLATFWNGGKMNNLSAAASVITGKTIGLCRLLLNKSPHYKGNGVRT